MARLPTGTVTFLFSDIEGSTTRWEHGREAMQRALARHDAIMRDAIEAHGGHVFKTVGDAFYAVFTTAPQGVVAGKALVVMLLVLYQYLGVGLVMYAKLRRGKSFI